MSSLRGFTVLFLVWLSSSCLGGEREECQRLSSKYNALVEVVLWDRSRVDLLTAEYAIEVDWSPKWAEAIGQCQWYGIVTGRKPAVLLLVKDKAKEARYIYRATAVCAKLGIKLFLEEVQEP